VERVAVNVESVPDEDGMATFVVTSSGALRLGPRRSEHVSLAEGHPVLSAGEVRLVRDGDTWRADEITNQSTGHQPDPTSRPATANALGIPHQTRWTTVFVFRSCRKVRGAVTVGSLGDRRLSPRVATKAAQLTAQFGSVAWNALGF
jgi:hypothetical protein